ncbi:MAG: TonB-dependent receptor, partial [Pseudomonadota bacterium]
VQNVEIFRGPQSTVQGRNALAGAVVLNTVDPSYEFEGSTQAFYADYGTWRASAASSIPISDTFALRVAVDESQTDGFITNPTLMTDESDRRETTTIRAKALWEPAGVDNLSIRFNYTDIESFRGDGRVVRNLFPPERLTFENIQSRIDTEGEIASMVVDYGINDTWDFTSVTSYTETYQRFFIDPTRDERGGPSISDFVSNDEIFSQEFRLNFDTGRARGLLGAFLFNQEGDTVSESTSLVGTDFALPDPVTIAALFFQTPTPTPEQIGQAAFIRQSVVTLVPAFPVLFDRNNDVEIDNWALFGEVEYDLTDRWTMTLGLRYDREDIKQNLFDSTFVPPIQTGEPLVDQVLAVLASQFTNAVSVTDIDNDFDAWLPKAVFSYAWTDDISTAFSVQRGYRAGGLSVNVFRAALSPPDATQEDLEALGVVNSFEPEFTTNYELAFRSRLLDDRMTLNANLFYIDYTDQQITVSLSSNPLDTLTENVGESELYGFEVDLSYLVSDGFTVGANLGYVETEFTDGSGVLDDVIGGGVDLTGNEFTYAPAWTGGGFARYEWDSGWFINGRVRYSDESFTFPENDLNAVNDSYTVFDFIGGYIADTWRAEVFVDNAFDEEYLTVNFGPDDAAVSIAGAPRVYGARVVVSF